MDTILKEWKEFKFELADSIEQTIKEGEVEKDVLEVMLNLLTNVKVKINKGRCVE